jgi:L-2-hydroxyglutarate oxidase
MNKQTVDFLVVGGGVIGISVALELRSRHRNASITIVDKESNLGMHASGRNSGVLHAGFYYTADSLKARFCREGNEALKRYIHNNKLRINPCGKLVVAQSESELQYLAELKKRGDHNGVELYLVSESDAKKIEPRVRTFEQALWSPNTATADPIEVINRFREDAIASGIKILFEHPYIYRKNDILRVGDRDISAGYVVNCAGLYADRVALDYGFSQCFRILPFKGLYLYSNQPPGHLKTNIYPVPDLRNPFLGVHFTVTVDGYSKIGPTAIPAFWREQYSGLSGFQPREFFEVAWRNLGLVSHSGFEFRRLALEEFQKYSKRRLVSLAGKLLHGTEIEKFSKWGRPGIRAQLLNIESLKLEMDFVIEGDKKSIHILNAVSPAWTCSIPFAKYVCDQIEKMQSK